MQHSDHHSLPRRWTRTGGVALTTAVVLACGDDGSQAGTTTDASATATSSSTTATTITPTTTTATSTATSGSDSGTASTTAEATTMPATTISTEVSSSAGTESSGGSESETAGDDTGAVCEPGVTEDCYTGPDGTLGVGVCVAGMRTCNDAGTAYGPWAGEVTPTVELCETVADENCLGDVPECGDALWNTRFGGVASDESTDLAVGPDDGIVITGVFDAGSSINFGGSSFVNKGGFDGFIASFDGDGGHRWSRAFGSPTSDAARSVAIDAAGAVIITGDTQGAIDLGGGLLTSAGAQDVIVAKFDGDGGHLWSTIYKSPQQQVGLHCAVTSNDAVILGGVFRGSIDFGGGALVSAGLDDIYLTKLDANGKHQWSKRFGDASIDYVSAMMVDSSDAIVQAGFFAGSLDYGGGILMSAGGNDVFVAKLDGNGGHLWSKRFGNAGDQRVEGAGVAEDGRVLIGGAFDGAIDFGGGVLTSGAGKDAFIAVFDATGSHLWSRRLSGPGNDRVTTIAAAPDGNVLVGGVFAGSLDLGGVMLTSDGLYDAFVAKYDPTGELLFSASYDASGTSWITNVAADSFGDVFILGHFKGTLEIDGEAMISAGFDDVFLAKLAI